MIYPTSNQHTHTPTHPPPTIDYQHTYDFGCCNGNRAPHTAKRELSVWDQNGPSSCVAGCCISISGSTEEGEYRLKEQHAAERKCIIELGDADDDMSVSYLS